MFLREIDIYYSYNFKSEFNSRNDFELEINPVYSVIDEESYDSIIEYINTKSSEEDNKRINKIFELIDGLEDKIIKLDD